MVAADVRPHRLHSGAVAGIIASCQASIRHILWACSPPKLSHITEFKHMILRLRFVVGGGVAGGGDTGGA